jgi:hypothetical protein
MRKYIILALGILLMTPSIYSQTVQRWTEDFDGNVSFTTTSANSWVANTVYSLPGSSTTNPKSILGLVPTQFGDSISLETPVYNCTGYDYILLRFSHICKVSPLDNVRVEYRIDMGGGMGIWESFPAGTYLGSASNFTQYRFSAANYPEWEANDNSKFPNQDWWKEEIFDLTGFVNQFSVQFRFIITRGQVHGTQASYGWLIDNFQLLASNDPLIPPTIELVKPLVIGTVYSAGTWEINAKVKTNTTAPLQTPWLKYTATNNGVSKSDSVLMTLVSQNDGLWKAEIPQFEAGSTVVYSITGKDTLDNTITANFKYTIVQENRNAIVLQDGGGYVNNNNTFYPFAHNFGYARSMVLYPGDAINLPMSGEIHTLSLRVAVAGNGAFPLKIWLKTVPTSITAWDKTIDNQPWSVLTQDAKLVYDGEFHFNTLGWMDIPFDSSFYYDGIDNLVVMFEQNCGGPNCYSWMKNTAVYPIYHFSGSQPNRFWLKVFDSSPANEPMTVNHSYYSINGNRPDLRIGLTSAVPDNSVIAYAINIDDTIVISPSDNIPISVTIRNRGNQLSSAKVAYSVNGSNSIEKILSFNPALAWDMNYTDTLGTYNPKLNGNDTIKVWVSDPNGNTNLLLGNDTLTKIIYGCQDITMRFINFPTDTVNSTGPYEITAEINSRSGISIGQISLYITHVLSGVTTYDTLSMVNTSGNLWKTVIPKKLTNSDISCSIKIIDIAGNSIVLEDSYYIKGIYSDLNSVALTSIEMSDTVFVSPSSSFPIVVTIKNKGELDLSSVKVSYSINGSAPVDKNINLNPALPWDFTLQDTGYYSPKANGKDTIKVWASMPNGQTDIVNNDDTLTKIIYGSSDIALRFVNFPQDSVYDMGPFDITAEIYTHSGANIGQVSLFVTSTAEGVTTNDTLLMVNTSDNLWKTTISQKVFGSDVRCAIKLTDILGNHIEIEDSYSIQRQSSFVTIGTGTTTNWVTPINLYYEYSFSRQLDLGTEFSPGAQGGTIIKLAWDYASGTSWTFTNQSCYFQAVDNATITSSAYIDPETNGSTLVWQGTLSATAAGWIEITLDQPFVLPPGKNLLVYWEQKSGNWVASMPFWRFTTTSFNSTARGYSTSSFAAAKVSNLSLNTARANVRFYMPEYTNSVALIAIHSPEDTKGIVASGTPVPVEVAIQNKGIKNLDSCVINWTVNGQTKPSYIYRGNLPEKFMDTVSIGSYLPVAGKWDTIVVWTSMPNGVVDSTTTDDTLAITTLGCNTIFSGTIKVGSGENYTTINDVLNSIRICGVTGDVILALKGAFDENIDLSGFEDYMGGYSLTITSLDNDADSAVINPLSGVGITLSNTRNLILKNITVNRATGGTSAIQFTGACTNIVIQDCKLILDSASTSTSGGVIYKANNTGIVDSIFVVNNLIEGGYAGFYFYGGISQTQYGTHVIFDGNIVKNNRENGIYFYYTDFISCSDNTILCRTVNAGTSWNPLDVNYSNGPVTHNRIMKREASTITASRGIFSNYHNHYLTSAKALIANNEIIHTDIPAGTGAIYAAIYANFSKSEILHNSIYMSGARDIRAIYAIGDSNDVDIMNNNVVVISSLGYPVYFANTTGTYHIDYNNIYGSVYIGYYGSTAIEDIDTWREQIPADLHSISLLPDFADDPPTNLRPVAYRELFCPSIASVSEDIEKVSRKNTTAMGAYTIPVFNQDLTLLGISSWNPKIILTQTIPVNVDVLNTGINPLTNVTFGWSLNGELKSPVTWMPATALGSFQQENNIPVGTFSANSDTAFDVVVWIASINGQPDVVSWGDTVSATANVIPMVEFVAPFVGDTIVSLSFEVNATIIGSTGAPITPPMLYLEAIIGNNAYHVYDSVEMIEITSGIWKANVPKQYYESNVIYSLVITDTTGYTLTVKDTVYIKYPDFGRIDETIIGTGTEGVMSSQGGNDTPINPAYPYNWSRQLYLFNEVCKSGSPLGTYIKSIAWESNTIAGTFDNQTCYMRAIDDRDIATAAYTPIPYPDPLDPSNHFQQVWQGSIIVHDKAWAEIILDVPYYLPYGKNLDILWHNENGKNGASGPTWYQTMTPSGAFMATSQRGSASLPQTASTGGAKNYRTNLKVITEDGAAFDPYWGNNLGLINIISPVNSVDKTCLPDFSPIRVNMRNLGEKIYDFSRDSVVLHAEIIDPYQIEYILSVVLNTGELVSGEMRTVEISPSFPVMDAGAYDIKIWIESSIDQMVYDDTLYYVYQTGRTRLPVEDDFSGNILSEQFISLSIVPDGGTEKWEPYTDPTSTILPPEGNGMLRYAGSHGTMARLKTRQLDLYRVTDPKLTFWYYYDNSASDLDNSYTEVSIVVDDVPINVRTLFRKGATTGWVKDSIDLTPYINEQCVYVQFESMNKYDTQSVQYLGLISITSTPDLAVSSILVSPDIALCAFANKDLYVVLSTTMNQAIDFSINEPDLQVEIGSQTFIYPLRHIIQGHSSDTILVKSNIDIKDITNIKAYLTIPVDRYVINDTASLVIDIVPALSITINPVTDVNSGAKKGSEIEQEVILTNTGNMDIPEIELLLLIDITPPQVIRETLSTPLKAGESTNYTFKNKYIVPPEMDYPVRVLAWLKCDSALVNALSEIQEYVDLHNISVVSIDNPLASQTDTVGSTKNITVTIENESYIKRYSNVTVTALIENTPGEMARLGTIPVIEPLETAQLTFAEKYAVPNDSVYYIKIYLNSLDIYPEDDTLKIELHTVSKDTSTGVILVGETNAFTLGQNIPNPANESTLINYSVPEAGEVIFHVHSISGQLLYSKTIEAVHGKQSIELNTNAFAAGIYFYSIEYKGQRLVKRMMISDE